jgi:anti-sigma factor RsiW
MTCNPEHIYAYLENELSGHDRARLEAHVQHCRACAQQLAQSRAVLSDLDHFADETLPASVAHQIIERTYDDLTMTFQNRAERHRALIGGFVLGAGSVTLLSLETVVRSSSEFLSGVGLVVGVLWSVASVMLQGVSLVAAGFLHRLALDANVSPLPALVITATLGVMFFSLLRRAYAPATRE